MNKNKKEYINDLKKSLSKLPAPKNDFEIVLPEDSIDESSNKSVKSKSSSDQNDDEELIDYDRPDIVGEQYEILDESEVQARHKQMLKARCRQFSFID